MSAKHIVVAVLLAACSSNKSSVDAPNNGDGSPIDSPTNGDSAMDSTTTTDAAVGVTCGTMTCTGMQECCVGNGGTHTCVDPGNCQGVAFACDGPEDCQSPDVCCLAAVGGMAGATCKPATMCQTDACHTDPDCPANTPKCCPVGTTGYNICLAKCP